MATVIKIQPAGDNHQVITVTGGSGAYRRKVCGECPWRRDAVGEFPAQAFRNSASTSYDMAQNTFACHMSGSENPTICAGFLLRGAAHNMSVRLSISSGKIQNNLDKAGPQLFDNYKEMAIANGVDPEDTVLINCRDGGYR